jgi:hypothetical protein
MPTARATLAAEHRELTGKKISLAPEAGAGNYRLVVSVNDPDSTQKVYSSLTFRMDTLCISGGTQPAIGIVHN